MVVGYKLITIRGSVGGTSSFVAWHFYYQNLNLIKFPVSLSQCSGS
jgi:hypothetical protein